MSIQIRLISPRVSVQPQERCPRRRRSGPVPPSPHVPLRGGVLPAVLQQGGVPRAPHGDGARHAATDLGAAASRHIQMSHLSQDIPQDGQAHGTHEDTQVRGRAKVNEQVEYHEFLSAVHPRNTINFRVTFAARSSLGLSTW